MESRRSRRPEELMSQSAMETSGRAVPQPSRFAWADWKAILLRVKDEIGADNLSLVAAGIAFYCLLAFFPAMSAFVGVYGLVADARAVDQHLAMLAQIAPGPIVDLIGSQVKDLVSSSGTTLGWTTGLSLLLALWSTRSGVNALVTGLNIAYGVDNERGFFAQVFTTLALTVLLLVFALIAFAAIVAVPAILAFLPLGPVAEWVAATVRWPIVLGALLLALAALYRWGPDRPSPRIEWFSWGAAAATLLWLVGSVAFSLYVANFANYNATYGAIGAVVALLMWFYLSAFIVLLGAEWNSEMERQAEIKLGR